MYSPILLSSGNGAAGFNYERYRGTLRSLLLL